MNAEGNNHRTNSSTSTDLTDLFKKHDKVVSAFAIQIPTPLRSKSNFRRSGSGKTWNNLVGFELTVAHSVRAGKPGSWVDDFGIKKVADRPVVGVVVAAKSKLDAANFTKSAVDACEKILYVSDASVLGTACIAQRGVGTEFTLGFVQLEKSSKSSELSLALSELVIQTSQLATFS